MFIHRDNYLLTYSLALGVLIIFLLFKKYFGNWTTMTFKFMKGIRGESAIANILTQLPNDYSIYKNVTMPENLADIDFVVVGPAGIFSIEVKSHHGMVGYDGNKLTLNGQPFEGNFLETIQKRYWDLHNYLVNETKLDVFVTPIIVFSDDRTMVRLGPNKINNTHVINKQWLLKTINQHQWYRYQEEKDSINNAVRKLIANTT